VTAPAPGSGQEGSFRTRRFLGGMSLTLLNQIIALLVGLWFTRFALGRLGQHEYGLWLVGLQIVAYLGLLDLGVVALLPRETAFAAGREKGGRVGAVAALVGDAVQLVVWQTPVVALLAVGAGALVSGRWAELFPAAAVILAAYVVAFPLRLFGATLQGLQDLAFLGWVQLGAWAAGMAVSIAMLYAGHGLQALAAGWVVSQFAPPAAQWLRLRSRFPEALPRRIPRLAWPAARSYLARSLWVSLSQIAVLLTNGADVLIIAALLGPSRVVPYVLTGKLVAVAANLPYTVAHSAGPGLSEMRVRETRERLREVTTALTLGVLFASGFVMLPLLALNQAFVRWWVGPEQFGGLTLSALFVLLMLARHWSITLAYTAYSFGHERATALIGVAQGLVVVAATLALVPVLGIVGGALGALAGELLVTLPLVLRVVAREVGESVGKLLAPLASLAARLAALALLGVLVPIILAPDGLGWLIGGGAVLGALYLLVLWPVALRPPLRPYVVRTVAAAPPWLGRLDIWGRNP
jgi:O-antigen/teichoic acid export membrane protein